MKKILILSLIVSCSSQFNFFRGKIDDVKIFVRSPFDEKGSLTEVNTTSLRRIRKVIADYETSSKRDRNFNRLLTAAVEEGENLNYFYVQYKDKQPMNLVAYVISKGAERETPLPPKMKDLFYQLFDNPNMVLTDEYSRWPLFNAFVLYLSRPTDKKFVSADEFFKKLVLSGRIAVRKSLLSDESEESLDDSNFDLNKRLSYWLDDFVTAIASNLAYGYGTIPGSIFYSNSLMLFYLELAAILTGNDVDSDLLNELTSKQSYSSLVPTAAELACILNSQYGEYAFDTFVKMSDQRQAKVRPQFIFTVRPNYKKIKGEEVELVEGRISCKDLLKGKEPYLKEWLNLPEISVK